VGETCQGILDDIHGCLGDDFAERFDVRFVRAAEAVDLYGSAIHQCARSYLPVWEDGNGDYACVHLAPWNAWQEQAWVTLRHDASAPQLIASSFRMLPRVLHLTALCYPDMSDEQWQLLEELADVIPSAEALDADSRLLVPDSDWAEVRAVLDPGNSLEVLISKVNKLKTPKSILKAAQGLLPKYPDDPFVHAVLAMAQKELGDDDAAAMASEAMLREFPWRSERWLDPLHVRTNLIDLWERLGRIALQSQKPAGALEPLRAEDALRTSKVASATMDVSKRLLSAGNTLAAFHVARNGLTLAAGWRVLSEEWFEWMQSVTALAAPHSPALELLRLCKSTFIPGEH
jgi:hypothetical protein